MWMVKLKLKLNLVMNSLILHFQLRLNLNSNLNQSKEKKLFPNLRLKLVLKLKLEGIASSHSNHHYSIYYAVNLVMMAVHLSYSFWNCLTSLTLHVEWLPGYKSGACFQHLGKVRLFSHRCPRPRFVSIFLFFFLRTITTNNHLDFQKPISS